jgi:hypothetical protein
VQCNYENGYGASEDNVCASALPSIMAPVRLSLMASIAPVSFFWYMFEMPQEDNRKWAPNNIYKTFGAYKEMLKIYINSSYNTNSLISIIPCFCFHLSFLFFFDFFTDSQHLGES